jgi:GntR family transcriptional regulator
MAGKMSFSKKIGMQIIKGKAPLYLQLQESIRTAIQEKNLQPREALPPERDLAEELGISRITVRNAISGLVKDGLLARKQGNGTFVLSRVEKQFALMSSFTEDMAGRGLVADSKWLLKTKGPVTPDEAILMGVRLGSQVYRFNRLRLADGNPMSIEHSIISADALQSENDVVDSLYKALEASGHRPVRALQRLRALHLNKDQAELLETEPGAAGLFVERHGYDAKGATIEISRSWYRGDSYDFVAELNA